MPGSTGIRRIAVALVVLAIAALAAAGSVPRAGSAVGATFVRVNQVGYPTGGAKRAYLMSAVDATGAAFIVKNASGAVIFSGQAGGSLGSWSRTYPFVHPLDFDGVNAAGTYTIEVTNAAASPSFRIDGGRSVYAGA